ncbi:MAG: cation-translocating P-type ATPase [Actinomycetota bacterium]|jgi:Cu+-exporting ATPase|nr:cation-translocating P-type ATPase [Actinomycetota bacterium]
MERQSTDVATTGDVATSCQLTIEGMTCASCVRRVERALTAVDGVAGTRVNLATESARVDLNRPVGIADLLAAVEAAGYRAAPVSRASDPAEEAAARRARRTADLIRRRSKLGVGVLGSVVVLVLAYGFGSDTWSRYLQLAVTAPIFVWVGADFHRGALASLRHHRADMDTLVSLGSSVAFIYSVASVTVLAAGPTYFDVAAVIVTLISVGKYFEVLTRGRAGAAIEALASRSPRTSHLLARAGAPAGASIGSDTLDVSIESLRTGDLVLVRPGDVLPTDGVVIEGSSAVDEAMVSGESTPVRKVAGDEVTGGTVNGMSPLVVRVTRAGADSTLAQIMALVERAQLEKSNVQRAADRVSSVFVPVILAAALATFAGWLASGHSLVEALIPAVAVLVVACPCALGLATPVAVMVGSGRGAELGLLVSGGEVLERVRRINTVVVDKTGTLTVGRPTVVEIVEVAGAETLDAPATGAVTGAGDLSVLACAAAAESASEHPLARAIQAALAGREGPAEPVTVHDAVASAGVGVTASVNGHRVRVGSPEWVVDDARTVVHTTNGISSIPAGDHGAGTAEATSVRQIAERLAARGLTPVAVGVDGRVRLLLGITDPLRPDAVRGVARLHAEGLRVVLATGDRAEIAERIANETGVDEVYAGLRPEGKETLVRELRARGGPVAMVGDGINDAPALAAADVGIAVGTAAGIAMATAEITLVHGDIGAVADAIALSRATRRTIWQNLGWAFGYNVVLVPLAAVGILPPMIAAAAMAASSVSVVANALRLRRFGRRTPGSGRQPTSSPTAPMASSALVR